MNKLTLTNNIEVEITKIYQMKTYDSLIEGIADKEFNDDLLIDIKQRAKRVFFNDAIHIIDSRLNEDDDFSSFTVILELTSFQTFKDLDKDFSSLIVVFFQDQFAFPINDENLILIKEILFGLLCKEYFF